MKGGGGAIAMRRSPGEPSAIRDSAAFVSNSRRARLASLFATWKPTLWRGFAYPSAGLRRPTTRRSTRGGGDERPNNFARRTSSCSFVQVDAEKGLHRQHRWGPAGRVSTPRIDETRNGSVGGCVHLADFSAAALGPRRWDAQDPVAEERRAKCEGGADREGGVIAIVQC